jgi:hypothetical protein
MAKGPGRCLAYDPFLTTVSNLRGISNFSKLSTIVHDEKF